MDLAQLATLLTVAGVAVYVVGLVGVALSIQLTLAETWDTAWYAVSLMPRTVVAGQGLRIWRRGWVVLGWYLIIFAGGLLVPVAIYLGVPSNDIAIVFGLISAGYTIAIWFREMAKSFREIGKTGAPRPSDGKVVQLLEALGVDFRSDSTEPQKGAEPQTGTEPQKVPEPEDGTEDGTEPQRRLRRATRFSLLSIGAVLSLTGGIVAFNGVRPRSDLLTRSDAFFPAIANFIPITVNWNNITLGILVFVVGAFLAAIAVADRVEHPLPKVELIETGEPPLRTQKHTAGWLIAHTDGYWHIFDKGRNLVSVPDERVTEARVDDPGIIRATRV